MTIQPNLKLFDRYSRLVGGLVIYGLASKQRRGRGAMMSIGAMKIAEGVTGWCPMKYGVQTLERLGEKYTQRRSSHANVNADEETQNVAMNMDPEDYNSSPHADTQ